MQVFLCWSGAASHRIAQALHGFLGDVIQDLKPFLSSESIRKGQRWESEIGKRLADTNYGIVCLTKDNLTAPWILFEAGALSKNIAESRVTALLAGIQPTDVLDPLSQFQQTRADRADLFKLLKDLNELLPPERRLEVDRLTRAFDSFWPSFETNFNEAISFVEAKTGLAPMRDTQDMVSELLELVREMKRDETAVSERAMAEANMRVGQVMEERHRFQVMLEHERARKADLEQEIIELRGQLKKLQNENLR